MGKVPRVISRRGTDKTLSGCIASASSLFNTLRLLLVKKICTLFLNSNQETGTVLQHVNKCVKPLVDSPLNKSWGDMTPHDRCHAVMTVCAGSRVLAWVSDKPPRQNPYDKTPPKKTLYSGFCRRSFVAGVCRTLMCLWCAVGTGNSWNTSYSHNIMPTILGCHDIPWFIQGGVNQRFDIPRFCWHAVTLFQFLDYKTRCM